MQELDVSLTIAHVLDTLGVAYCVGGSLASIVYTLERGWVDAQAQLD